MLLQGTIAVTGLPVNRGLMVHLCFYRVDSAETPAPHGGDPPAEAATDCHLIYKQVDLNTETAVAAVDVPFALEREAGFYYLEVRAVLFRKTGEKIFAQAEQFFFARRPLPCTQTISGLSLPVAWPTIPLEDLGSYGVIESQKKPE